MSRWRRTATEREGGASRGGALGVLLRTVPVVCLLAGASPGAAQEPSSLRQLESGFTSAVLEYEAALSAATTQRQLWEEKVVALDSVRGSGNDEAADAAFRELSRESAELQRLERRVRSTEEAAGVAKLALLAGLDLRREELEARYASAGGAAERRQVEDLLLDVTRQYVRLENEPLASAESVQPFFSSITFDPRDQAPDLRIKIQLLERRVRMADSTVTQVDRRIERLRGRQRIEQMSEDFQAGVGRFDDDLLRTGSPLPTGSPEEGMPTDSVGAREAVPPQQQIEEAQLLREQLVEARDELSRRAAQFRERLRVITS